MPESKVHNDALRHATPKSLPSTSCSVLVGAFPVSSQEVPLECHGPIACKDIKVGVYAVDPENPKAKAATTLFTLLHRMPDGTSVVRCLPRTGRTHQIRVHLMHLGYPIANDGCYGGDDLFPGTRRQPHDWDQPVASDPREEVSPKEASNKDGAEKKPLSGAKQEAGEAETSSVPAGAPRRGDDGSENGWQRTERSHAMEIWLHAHRYKSDTWAYEAEVPAWARLPT